MVAPNLDRLSQLAATTGRMLPEGVRIRPPTERGSLLIRATRGCTWNRCRYCNLYRDSTAGPRPIRELREDLALAHALYGEAVSAVFFGDADFLALPPDDAVTLVRETREMFPGLARVSAYMTPGFAMQWEEDDLARLAGAGLTRVYAGLDTNAATVHHLVQRPGTPADQRAGLDRIQGAGFELWVSVMLGLGGARYSEEHVEATVACLNALAPDVVRVCTLACGEGQPLTEPVLDGRLELAWAGADPSPLQSPFGTLDELRALVRTLTCATELVCDHASNFFPEIRGHLPAHRAAILAAIDEGEAHLRSLKRPVSIRLFA